MHHFNIECYKTNYDNLKPATKTFSKMFIYIALKIKN